MKWLVISGALILAIAARADKHALKSESAMVNAPPLSPGMKIQIMKLFVCACVLFSSPLRADEILSGKPVSGKGNYKNWYFQYQYGFASDADFVPSLILAVDRSQERSYLNSASVGRQLSKSIFGYKADVVGYLGFQYYSEKGFQDDITGTTLYWKVSRKFRVPFTSFLVRLGLGQGMSYVSDIPTAERRDFEPKLSARWLYYLDYSAHLSVSDLTGRSGMPLSRTIDDIYIGYSIFHRSSVFGQFAEARGGVNYPGIGLEVVFR